MRYAVDRIENNIAILENIETKEKKDINISSLSFEVSEKDILILKDNNYYKDDNEKEKRIAIIKAKLEQAKQNKKR